MTAEYKLTLPLRTADDAEPEAAQALRDAQKQLGFVPNMYAAMANAPGVLTTYQHGYGRFRTEVDAVFAGSAWTPADAA